MFSFRGGTNRNKDQAQSNAAQDAHNHGTDIPATSSVIPQPHLATSHNQGEDIKATAVVVNHPSQVTVLDDRLLAQGEANAAPSAHNHGADHADPKYSPGVSAPAAQNAHRDGSDFGATTTVVKNPYVTVVNDHLASQGTAAPIAQGDHNHGDDRADPTYLPGVANPAADAYHHPSPPAVAHIGNIGDRDASAGFTGDGKDVRPPQTTPEPHPQGTMALNGIHPIKLSPASSEVNNAINNAHPDIQSGIHITSDVGSSIGEHVVAPRALNTTSSAPANDWNKNLDGGLGSYGGSDLASHGTALASKVNADGSKLIVQMSDGTYESVDRLIEKVTSAGTWGDGQGGGVAQNGVGNPLSGSDAMRMLNSTSSSATTASHTSAPLSGSDAMKMLNPTPASGGSQPPADTTDAVSRYMANAPSSAPTQTLAAAPLSGSDAMKILNPVRPPAASDAVTRYETNNAPAAGSSTDATSRYLANNTPAAPQPLSGSDAMKMLNPVAAPPVASSDALARYEVNNAPAAAAYVEPVPSRPDVTANNALGNFGVDTHIRTSGTFKAL